MGGGCWGKEAKEGEEKLGEIENINEVGGVGERWKEEKKGKWLRKDSM